MLFKENLHCAIAKWFLQGFVQGVDKAKNSLAICRFGVLKLFDWAAYIAVSKSDEKGSYPGAVDGLPESASLEVNPRGVLVRRRNHDDSISGLLKLVSYFVESSVSLVYVLRRNERCDFVIEKQRQPRSKRDSYML